MGKFSSEEKLDGSPCNVRFWTSPQGNKLAVVPTLEGLVYVYNGKNPNSGLVHTINVTKDMGLRHGHDDPHDAIFTKAGDIVVGTYADGYVGYWKLAGWSQCGPSSKACCNPYTTPHEICPNGEACQECGGDVACECPQSTPLSLLI